MPKQPSAPITYRTVLALAWPASIASLITPLLGLIDATVLGYSARPLDVGAVGLAAAIFSLAYWTFGFLRMSTAGLTAQAIGAGEEVKARRILAQSTGFGGIIGMLFLLLQVPFGAFAFWLMTRGTAVDPATVEAAKSYYAIRIWGAPFAMVTYGVLGWLTARGRTGLLMAVVAGMTVLNMILDVIFVLHFEMGAAGVAAGTLIAEITGAFIAGGCVLHVLSCNGGIATYWREIDYFAAQSLKRLFVVNVDIFIRTLILVSAFVFFIQRSGVYGDLILSANQLLLQFFLLTGLALDGAAIAAETLVGQSLGLSKEDERRMRFGEAVKKSAVIAGTGAAIMSLLYLIFYDPLINLTAPDPAINETARQYFIWIIISPLVVAACFQMDGFYIGATRSQALRNSMIMSGTVYLIALWLLTPPFANHGLWLAFGAFMIARALSLWLLWPGFEPLLKQGQATEA